MVFFFQSLKKWKIFAIAKNALKNTNYLRAYLATGKKWTKFATFFKTYSKEIFATHWKNLTFNFKLLYYTRVDRFFKRYLKRNSRILKKPCPL